MSTHIEDEGSSGREIDAEAGERSLLATARLGVFYLSVLLAGAMTVAFLPDLLALLVTGWSAAGGAELGIHRVHVMGIATVVSAFLLGLFAQAYRPRERVASMWGAFVLIVFVTVATVGLGVGRPEEVVPFLLVTGVALVSHPAGRRLLRRGDSYSPALLALVLVAAVPLLAFAAGQLSLSTSTTDPHALDGHYVMMAGLAIAPLAYGIFAASGFVGWRLASWFAAAPMAYYGLLSIAFPAQSGAAGLVWGTVAVLWAVAFVAISEYSGARTSASIRREIRRPT